MKHDPFLDGIEKDMIVFVDPVTAQPGGIGASAAKIACVHSFCCCVRSDGRSNLRVHINRCSEASGLFLIFAHKFTNIQTSAAVALHTSCGLCFSFVFCDNWNLFGREEIQITIVCTDCNRKLF